MTAAVQPQQESHFSDLSPRHHPAQDLSPRHHPVTMQQPVRAKSVTVYVNGDKYYPGRKFVVNRRHIADFDGFLNMVTNGLKPAFGAVRNIYTPHYGHKVTELEGIDERQAIVAGGLERFKRLQYQEITAPSRKPGRPRNDYASIRPVYHNTRMNVAARWKDFAQGPITIHVYWNGDINGSAVRILLIPRIMKLWDLVLTEVTEKLSTRTGKPVRRLYTLHGELVLGTEDLTNGGYYVACANEKLKRLPYGERAQHFAMMHTAKKPQVPLPPIRRRVRTLNSKPHDASYSQKYAARKQLEGERQQQSQPPPGASRPPPNRRLRPIRGAAPPPSTETESVFHAKPVKVKRSGASGKLTAVSAEDDHEDDVFRAKRGQVKAEEVADDEDTKVDLPIDQVPADTVEDEDDLDVAVKHEEAEKRENSPTTEPKKTYATRLEEADSELTEPSKTPTSASRDEPHPTARSVEETEPNGAVIQPSEDKPAPSEEAKTKTEDEAAVLIQATYKGYKVRKDLKQQQKDDAKLSDADSGEGEPESVETIQNESEDPQQPLPLSEPRAETPNEADPASQRSNEDVAQQEQPDETQEQPVVAEESRPASTEVPSQPSPPPAAATTEEQPQAFDHPATPSAGTVDEVASAAEQPEEAKPVTAEESDRQSPVTDDTKIDQPVVEAEAEAEATQEQPQPSPTRSESPHVVENNLTSATAEDGTGLPERDAGDGTEESETQQQPNGEPQLNGSVPSGDTGSQDVKASQDSTARPISVTPSGEQDTEQPQKSPPETVQIPNGQPATISEGGV